MSAGNAPHTKVVSDDGPRRRAGCLQAIFKPSFRAILPAICKLRWTMPTPSSQPSSPRFKRARRSCTLGRRRSSTPAVRVAPALTWFRLLWLGCNLTWLGCSLPWLGCSNPNPNQVLQQRQEVLVAAQQEHVAGGDGVKSEASTVEASLPSDPASSSAMIALDDEGHVDLATPALFVIGAGNPLANGEYDLASSLHNGCPLWVQRGAAVEASAWRLYWSCGPAEVGWSLSTDFEMPHYLCEVDQQVWWLVGVRASYHCSG